MKRVINLHGPVSQLVNTLGVDIPVNRVLETLIAAILNDLESSGKINYLRNEQRAEFYRVLSELTMSLDGFNSHNSPCQLSSLEMIASNQSKVKYKDNWFRFINFSKSILHVDKIVIKSEEYGDYLELAARHGVFVKHKVKKIDSMFKKSKITL